jgi:hypothetical protein
MLALLAGVKRGLAGCRNRMILFGFCRTGVAKTNLGRNQGVSNAKTPANIVQKEVGTGSGIGLSLL